jgi:hypothetical protein
LKESQKGRKTGTVVQKVGADAPRFFQDKRSDKDGGGGGNGEYNVMPHDLSPAVSNMTNDLDPGSDRKSAEGSMDGSFICQRYNRILRKRTDWKKHSVISSVHDEYEVV